MSLDVGDRQPIPSPQVGQVADATGLTQADRWAGLLAASGRGEHASFGLLARESRDALRFRAQRIVPAVVDAEEVVHHALLEAWCTARSYDPMRWSVSTWLGQIVVGDHHLVRAALPGLTDRQRQAVRLAYHEGLSSTQAAQRLGVPTPIMRTRLRDGIDRLRSLVTQIEPIRVGGAVPRPAARSSQSHVPTSAGGGRA